MMSRKIVYLLAIVVFIAFSVPTFAQSESSGEAYLSVRVAEAEPSVVLGQDDPAKKPGLFERMKRSFANWAKEDFDDEDEYYDEEPRPEKSIRHDSRQEPAPPTKPVSIPTKPPKPVKATEVRKAVDQPDSSAPERQAATPNRASQNQRTASTTAVKSASSATTTTAQKPANSTASPKKTAPPVEAPVTPTETEETPEVVSEDTIFERLKSIREQVFDKQQIDESVYQDQSVETRTVRSAPTPSSSGRPTDRVVESSRTAQPSKTDRTPPPRSRIAEPIEYSPIVTLEEEIVEEPRSEPSPRSRTIHADRSPTDTRVLETARRQENVRHHDVQPTRIHSFETETNFDDHRDVVATERTASLSKVEVQRNANRQRIVSRPSEPELRRTESYDTPSQRKPAVERREPERVASTVIETSIPVDAAAAPRVPQDRSPDRGKTVMASPRIEVETESSPRAMVGQEAVYKIRVLNRGGSAAEQVVLSIEVPDWIEIRQPEVSAGTTSTVPRSNVRDIRDFVWKVSRIEANAEALLVLRLVPQQRKSMDLKIRYDFFKPAAVAKLVVQEPVLEMELDGPAEVLWGTRVGYRLLVRNVGNGDAENVQLELLQTGSDMKSCELPLLRAGEEQVIDVDVWTGKQESIDINIQATGRYDLSGKVSKKVKVMRPEVVVSIEAPAVQFVGSPAEFVVKVRNVGGAEAKDLELAATLPLGARFDSCSAGGEMNTSNQIFWKIDSIPVNDVFTATVVCEPKREGTCKLEASASDASGVLARCDSAFDAAAIVELKLDVDNPPGPIEVGRESVYTVHLVNRGTKAAENVEATVFFGKHLEPYAIEGGTAYTSDGQVVFDKIPTIGPGQRLTLKVKARAEAAGSHRVRTEVVCGAADIHLVNEQATYFFSKNSFSKDGNKDKEKPASNLREEPRERIARKPTPTTPTIVPPVKSTAKPELPAIAPPVKKSPTVPEPEKTERKSPATLTPPPLPVIAPTAKSADAKPVDPFLQ